MSFDRLTEEKRELGQEITACEQKINELSAKIDRLEAAYRELDMVRIQLWGVRHNAKTAVESASDWKGQYHDIVLESATSGHIAEAYNEYSDHIGDKIYTIKNVITQLQFTLGDYKSNLISLEGRYNWYDTIGA